MHDAVKRIHDSAEVLRGEHRACDQAGKLTERTVEVLKQSQGMKLLQARSHGGLEADIRDFYAWVRAVARYNPSAGWVAGVVGVHPWELALCDAKLQDEIYGRDAGTWVASPYAPFGRARRVEGGFVLNGEWPYSTGTDHCTWIVLGGMVMDADGNVPMPPDVRHFFLPRGDYQIIEDSWQVMGLIGTGSKNVRVVDAFVPDHRIVGHVALSEGQYNERRGDTPLYHLPFGCVFSAAISSATFGIAQGTLDVYREQLQSRVSVSGVVGKSDPFQQQALAEAEADLAAGISHVDAMSLELLARIGRGEPMSAELRLDFRRNQVRAVQRVLGAVDRLLARAGSPSVWTTRPLEHYWRDLRTAGTHICNVTDSIYPAWAAQALATGAMVNAFY
ncbi:MAG: acyl-CoA dehydrogenase [Proteobacteria bacterium]|nr:acyl-CoA dehydrogenase [Pseudomonadota bacterium]